MIKKIKSKLSVKVFIITALLTAFCCIVTYLCIIRFAPYIYLHETDEAEGWVDEAASILDLMSEEEIPYWINDLLPIFAEEMDKEYVIHIFRNTGEELRLPNLDSTTGRSIADYKDCEKTRSFTFQPWENEDEYVVFAARNTDLESQAVGALEKALPVLGVVIVFVSMTAAFFYTRYMTGPIKKISAISRRMADMEFDTRCAVRRTDEIGVLSDSLNELSVRLSAALSDLREANGKLQADIDRERLLEQQRSAFFSAASHELKTPITIIKGQLEGMLYQVGRYQDRETYLARSLEVTNTLETMVQELLMISRLETPGYICKKDRVDLSSLAAGRLAALDELFLQRELTVQGFVSPDIMILGDARLLEKVLDNLLSNAAAYSPAGERVTVKLWREAENVRFTVENTGVQIPDEAISKLFEAFYRVEASRNRQTGGSGLGLYIVRTILDLHGASVSITNTKQGVTASVRFISLDEA